MNAPTQGPPEAKDAGRLVSLDGTQQTSRKERSAFGSAASVRTATSPYSRRADMHSRANSNYSGRTARGSGPTSFQAKTPPSPLIDSAAIPPKKPMRSKPSLEEDELQKQLADLGASLGKLKGFTSSARRQEEKDSPSIKRVPSNRRPRLLERTASDSEAPRYECVVHGPPGLVAPVTDGQHSRRTDEQAETAACVPARGIARREHGRRSPATRGSSSIMRRATFSYGTTPAAEPDHHAIAALPPEQLLKQVLFDSSSGDKPVSKPVRRIPRLERERKQST